VQLGHADRHDERRDTDEQHEPARVTPVTERDGDADYGQKRQWPRERFGDRVAQVPTEVPDRRQAVMAEVGSVLVGEAGAGGGPVEEEVRRRDQERADGGAYTCRNAADRRAGHAPPDRDDAGDDERGEECYEEVPRRNAEAEHHPGEDVVANRGAIEQPHDQQQRKEREEHAGAVGPHEASVGNCQREHGPHRGRSQTDGRGEASPSQEEKERDRGHGIGDRPEPAEQVEGAGRRQEPVRQPGVG